MKYAQLIADAVAVVCPDCGECQPNPDDASQQWMPEDFAKTKLTKCVSCDTPLHISWKSKVQFDVPDQRRKNRRVS